MTLLLRMDSEKLFRLGSRMFVRALVSAICEPKLWGPRFVALLAVLATILAFGVEGVLAQRAILLAALPTAVIATVFAEEYGGLASESSTAIIATRVISFVTIPLVIAVTPNR